MKLTGNTIFITGGGATVVEVKSSHAVYVSHPQAVAQIIEEAARGALVAAKDKETTTAAARQA